MEKPIFVQAIIVAAFLISVGSEARAMGKPLPKTSTETPAPQAPPAELSPISSTGPAKPLWESKHKDGKEWTAHVLNKLDTLGKDMLSVSPADATAFCPKYGSLSYGQRKEFWTYLMSAMVKYESSFKPAMSYKESFKDQNGKNVISRGLLQLSLESSRGYDCGFRNEQEIHDPYMNLSCGIRILNRWVSRDVRMAGKVSSKWRGGARYWSVLRTTSGSYNSIKTLAKAHPLCG